MNKRCSPGNGAKILKNMNHSTKGGSIKLAQLPALGFETRISVVQGARVRNVTSYNTLAQDKGDADYLST